MLVGTGRFTEKLRLLINPPSDGLNPSPCIFINEGTPGRAVRDRLYPGLIIARGFDLESAVGDEEGQQEHVRSRPVLVPTLPLALAQDAVRSSPNLLSMGCPPVWVMVVVLFVGGE